MGHSNERMDRVNNYKLTEYLKEGTTEAPNKPDEQTKGDTTEPNPARDN